MKAKLSAAASIAVTVMIVAVALVLFRSGNARPLAQGSTTNGALQSPIVPPVPTAVSTSTYSPLAPNVLPTAASKATPTEVALEFLRQVLPTKSGEPQVVL